MSSINIYYKKIMERFGKKAILESESNSTTADAQSEKSQTREVVPPDIINPPLTSEFSLKKREQKCEFKKNMSLVESILDDHKSLKLNTLTDYTHILRDFIKFSPKLDPKDYQKYLKFKSGLNPNCDEENFVVKGTLIKHANVLKRFLEKLHNQKLQNVSIEYYKTPKRLDFNFNPKVTREEIYRYHLILIDNKKYEDAILLHAMYELGLEPYNLCLLTFESLSDNRTIMLYDHKIRNTRELKLTESLYSELLYLKNLKKLKGSLSNYDKRESLDGVSVYGCFVFSTKATGIFNKFERKFGGLLKDFNLTPRDLIALSKNKEREGDKSFHR